MTGGQRKNIPGGGWQDTGRISSFPPQHGFHHMGIPQCLKHCLGQGCRREPQGCNCCCCVVVCQGDRKRWVRQGRESRFQKQYQSFRKLLALCHLWASPSGYRAEAKMVSASWEEGGTIFQKAVQLDVVEGRVNSPHAIPRVVLSEVG